jgi:S1-C subfamily serine protease
MRYFYILSLIFSAAAFSQTTPLTQRNACAQFSDTVVRIEAGDGVIMSQGTGFIVSEDGFILTAYHVVRSRDGGFYPSIAVFLPNGQKENATPVLPLSLEMGAQDFALLKITVPDKLGYLDLGSFEEIRIGGDATIIGFPFSAISMSGTGINQKFCLTASFAGTDIVTLTQQGWITQSILNGTPKRIPVNKDIRVDVVYFQGPSVKGISGSPIISRDTGHVVGIVTTKLTGITEFLGRIKDQAAGHVGHTITGNMDLPLVINQTLTVLDEQLANGLGSATGIDDPKEALRKAQRKKK